MPTTAYTFNPPLPPFHGWDARTAGNGGDPDEGTAYADFTVPASTVVEAEKRVLAWMDYHYDDDLRGAVATATPTSPGHFAVRVALARPRG